MPVNIQILNVNEDGEIYAINGETEQVKVTPVSLPDTTGWTPFHIKMERASSFLVEFPNDIVVLTTNEHTIGRRFFV